jgi:hypothetical protein
MQCLLESRKQFLVLIRLHRTGIQQEPIMGNPGYKGGRPLPQILCHSVRGFPGQLYAAYYRW